jgi:hypothetical protein
VLPAHLLGVTPTSPGYRTASIRPDLGDLAWAEGVVPAPHGDNRVNLQTGLRGEIELPDGITATLHLPGHEAVALEGGRKHLLG